MRVAWSVVATSISSVVCVPFVLAADHTAEFAHIYNYDPLNDGTVSLYGRVLQPVGYDPSKSYPLVVFYHGSGEKGSNNTSQVNGNIDGLVAAAQARGFFVYAPQVNAAAWYASSMDASMRVVSQIQRDFNIDKQRTYVTGLSMGGGGVWNGISTYGGAFAAAVPAAGVLGIDGLNAAQVLPGKPIWAFHAADDGTVRVDPSTRAMVNAIRAADGNKPAMTFRLNANPSNPYYNTGAPYYTSGSGTTYYSENNLRYTEYAGGGHNSWSRAYSDQNMYNWLLAQRNPIESLALGKKALFDFGSSTAVVTDSLGKRWNSSGYQTESTLGTSIPFAADSTGLRTTVEINIVRKFSGNYSGGVTAGSMYDSGIAGDGWVVGTTAGNATTIANPGILMIDGLTPNAPYELKLFGSRTGNDGGRGSITRYTIGTEWRDLNTADNLDRQAVFASVFANSMGEITLNVSVAPGTSRYGHLNGLELMALSSVPEPSMLAVPILALAGACLRRRRRHAPIL